MFRYIAIIILTFALVFAASACKNDENKQTPTDEQKTDADVKTPGDDKKTNDKSAEKPGNKSDLQLPISAENLEKLIGKPGKSKVFYYHLGECFTCQETIAKFDIIKTEFADDFEYYHFMSMDIENLGVNLADLNIDSKTPPTGYVFDQNNKLVWQQADPEFQSFVEGLKKAGMNKEISEPQLPPDYFDQPH